MVKHANQPLAGLPAEEIMPGCATPGNPKAPLRKARLQVRVPAIGLICAQSQRGQVATRIGRRRMYAVVMTTPTRETKIRVASGIRPNISIAADDRKIDQSRQHQAKLIGPGTTLYVVSPLLR